jgi:hypothetical protein
MCSIFNLCTRLLGYKTIIKRKDLYRRLSCNECLYLENLRVRIFKLHTCMLSNLTVFLQARTARHLWPCWISRTSSREARSRLSLIFDTLHCSWNIAFPRQFTYDRAYFLSAAVRYWYTRDGSSVPLRLRRNPSLMRAYSLCGSWLFSPDVVRRLMRESIYP